jgi:hypothetical protein
MKKTIYRPALLLAAIAPFAAACATGGGLPNDATAVVTPLTLEPPPIYALLGYRRELELTSEQVAALDAVAQEVQDENRPLVRELHERTRERSRQPGLMIVTAEGEPVLDEIRANQRRAGEAVAGILDEDQRSTVCELFARNRPGAAASNRGQTRAVADAAPRDPRMMQPAGWYWCVQERSAAVD